MPKRGRSTWPTGPASARVCLSAVTAADGLDASGVTITSTGRDAVSTPLPVTLVGDISVPSSSSTTPSLPSPAGTVASSTGSVGFATS